MQIPQPNPNHPPLRWGILGTAEIARKNWKAIRNSGNGVVVAVASRDPERSRRFIAECHSEVPLPTPPKPCGSYADLLALPEVEAVYIPLPTGLRAEWVLRAARAGKHVICEKPCAVDAAQVQEMIAACDAANVQFMDGVMFMHSRRLAAMREVLEDKARFGEVRRISMGFSFAAGPEFFTGNIRAHAALEPQGCVGDLGWYCIRLALWVLGRLPRQVRGHLLSQTSPGDGSAAVPTEFSAELTFDDGVTAGFYCAFRTELQQWAVIAGTRASIHISDFVLPCFGNELGFDVERPYYRVVGCEFNMEPNRQHIAVPEYSNSHPASQEANLFRHFAAQVRSGHRNGDWPRYALQTQQILDACLESARREGLPVTLG